MNNYEIPLILDSRESVGALNKSADGSYFQIDFDEGLNINLGSVAVTCELHSAEIWNNFPNIAATNNHFRFYYDDGINPVVQEDLFFPIGLYDIQLIENELKKELTNRGYSPGLIQVIGNGATQKVQLFLGENVQVDFTINDSFRNILGFNSQLVPPGGATTSPLYEEAPNVAAVNTVDYIILHSDLVSLGIPQNGDYQSILGKVQINVPPGDLINHEPFNAVRVPCGEDLVNRNRTRLSFWITDQNNNRLNTLGQEWSFTLIIRFKI